MLQCRRVRTSEICRGEPRWATQISLLSRKQRSSFSLSLFNCADAIVADDLKKIIAFLLAQVPTANRCLCVPNVNLQGTTSIGIDSRLFDSFFVLIKKKKKKCFHPRCYAHRGIGLVQIKAQRLLSRLHEFLLSRKRRYSRCCDITGIDRMKKCYVDDKIEISLARARTDVYQTGTKNWSVKVIDAARRWKVSDEVVAASHDS